MRYHRLTRVCFALPLYLLLAAGCAKPAGSVSGEVTLDGKPVKSGQITFTPADGQGPIVGGPVTDGKFAVNNVPTGSKVVSVQSALPPSDAEVSSGDAYVKGAKVAAVKAIPPETAGNSQTLDVVTGPQTFNVTLTSVRR